MMNTKTKTNRLLIVAIIELIFIGSFIGAIIGSIIYDYIILAQWCGIVEIIASVHLLIAYRYKSNDTEAFYRRYRVFARILIAMPAMMIVNIVSQNFGLVAVLIVGIVICLSLTKAFKYIDKEYKDEA